MQLTVAIIGAPHGLKGELRLDVRTDSPKLRLAVGAMLETDPPEFGPLTVERTRTHKGALQVIFKECHDRTCAEGLSGTKLIIETDEDENDEDDAWYPHELIGLEVLDPDGYTLGEVIALEPMPAQDLLVVREPDGIITRVPFVKDIVTDVDLDDNCVIVDAPSGLFSEEEMVLDAEEDKPDSQSEEANS